MKPVRILAIISAFVLVTLLVVPQKFVHAAGEKIQKVFVTNWPALLNTREQNVDENGHIKTREQGTVSIQGSVSVANPLIISVPNKKIKTLGSKDVGVTWTDRVTIPDLPDKVQYATYEGKGKLKYLTAVGVRGLGVEIWTDGELVAASDGRNLEAYFGLNTSNGWRLTKMDEAYSTFEVREEYPFSNNIKFFLYRTLPPNPFESTGGAHIELEVE